jgi:hypothetical protein
MHSLVSPCRAASSRSRQRNQKQKARPFTYHFLAHRILLSVSLSLSKKPPLDFPLKKKLPATSSRARSRDSPCSASRPLPRGQMEGRRTSRDTASSPRRR